ncbi:MAG: hypothetical protein FD187_555 [bacterium]|nr:MAG: hypothetical protein FD142_812 [bacterium]KAF0149965.1 MAG: hypothetical protein FD187_555 [bacterium]KAF0169073.1 MAG: hypothetical protein FD158_625 [bacterium]TXT21521.1 MAG: hypothetical protein FD132_614 [bacterium]
MNRLSRFLGRVLLGLALSHGAVAGEAPLLLASADTGRLLGSPDARIARALQDIRGNRLEDALREVDRVIAQRPDFRLAHLIRGDILMARSRPLTGLGTSTRAPADSLADLRDEARARLLRYIDQPAPDLMPRQILQLAPQHRHVLLADASRARLYVFENVNGEPKLVSDYYMTIGRNGTEKRVEGDKRTPVGVYRILSQVARQRLTDFYGAGAFPLDYPNAWDQAQRRGGHGIWLHGVPSDTYSRPPRSSDGCVVVSNPDLKDLSRYIDIGSTPVVIAERADWIDRDTWTRTRDGLLLRLRDWKEDWEARDPDRFLRHYSNNLAMRDSQGWLNAKRGNILNKDWIRVELSDVNLFLYPDGDMAYAEFRQHYASDKLSGQSSKRLFWRMEDGAWRVALETSAEAHPSTQLAKR